MKIVLITVFLWSVGVWPVLANLHPQLVSAPARPGETVVYSHPLHIWSYDAWSLELVCDTLAVNWQDQWRPLPLTLVSDSLGAASRDLLVAITIPWVAPGSHSVDLIIDWQYGVTMLYLVFDQVLHLLPLGSDDFQLRLDENHVQGLVPGEWFALAFDDLAQVEVIWNDQHIWQYQYQDAVSEMGALDEQTGFGWQQEQIYPTVGKAFSVKLDIPVREVEHEVVLQFSDALQPIQPWTINGVAVDLDVLAEHYILTVPKASGPGPFSVEGRVMPLVIAGRDPVWILAQYGSVASMTKGYVQRGWFGHEGTVMIEATAWGQPLAYHTFLLPDGRITQSDAQGRLILQVKPGLHRVISLGRRHQPIWVYVQQNQVVKTVIDLTDAPASDTAVAIWDLDSSDGVEWQLQMYTPRWQWILASEPRQIEGSLTTRVASYIGEWQLGATSRVFGDRNDVRVKLTPVAKSEQHRLGEWMWQGQDFLWSGQLRVKNVGLFTRLDATKRSLSVRAGVELGRVGRIQLREDQLLGHLSFGRAEGGFVYESRQLTSAFIRDRLTGWQVSYTPPSVTLRGIAFIMEQPLRWQVDMARSGYWESVLTTGDTNEFQVVMANPDRQAYLAVAKQRQTTYTWGDLSWRVAGIYSDGIVQTEVVTFSTIPIHSLGELTLQAGGQLANGQSRFVTGWDFSFDLGLPGKAVIGWKPGTGFQWQWGLSLITFGD